jgi:hypothetical protein
MTTLTMLPIGLCPVAIGLCPVDVTTTDLYLSCIWSTLDPATDLTALTALTALTEHTLYL